MSKYYNNPNGHMSLEEMVHIKMSGDINKYISKFRIMQDKCPHKKLIHKDEIKQCFYCESCQMAAFNEIKEHKNYYKVLNKKFDK